MKPYFMEMKPAAMSEIMRGIKNGLNRGVPSPAAQPRHSSKKDLIPPMPELQITPTCSLSTASRSRAESSTACVAAIRAYWVKEVVLAHLLTVEIAGSES